MINGNLYRFFNTCAVDPWIDIFATLMKDASSFFLRHVTLPSEFKDLLETVQKGEIEKAKWLVAEQNNITIDKGAINFYGNERTLIIQPFFQESLTRQVLSKCISPICRNPEDSTAIPLPPDFSELMEVTNISKAEFIDKINNWFTNLNNQSICRRPFDKLPSDSTFVSWEDNAEKLECF